MGNGAEYVKARNFITFDIDSRPEWREKTLFIDGLDEVRAGERDSRVALDKIRNRLDRLRPPGFRISCREADWLGGNDRESLSEVAPGQSQVTVVHLDPLDGSSIRRILKSRTGRNVDDLISESQRRGIWPLLLNPLTLEWLADAIGRGEAWPESRSETFEMACRALATEQNPEHRIVASLSPAQATEAAGYLCALQLLAGLEGYSQHGESRSFRVRLDQIFDGSEIPPENLRGALDTKVFTAEGQGFFRPVHRQVAEYLGGRHLAGLVDDGLPVRRVTALMTSPSDGRVVAPLRGLSAWLVAQSRVARGLLIDTDPVGVGLYGDISHFTKDDKTRLLRSLATASLEEPLSGHGQTDTPPVGHGNYKAWPFRSLVSQDMLPFIEDLLDGQGGAAPNDRLVEFLSEILAHADGDLESLATLGPILYTIVLDTERSPWVRGDALDAYLNVVPPGESRTQRLRRLLHESRTSTIQDPNDELRGTLLRYLYPDRLPPRKVWEYVGPRNRESLFGRFWGFWNSDIFEKSSDQQIAELLDALYDNAIEILPSLQDSRFDELPPRLLSRALGSMGDSIETERLYGWLTATDHSRIRRRPGNSQTADEVRAWLEARPHIQKAIILKWLDPDDPPDHAAPYPLSFGKVLHYSRPPADLGLWFLEQTVNLAGSRPGLSQKLLKNAFQALDRRSIGEGLTLELMRERLRGHTRLTRELNEMHRQRQAALASSPEEDWHREMERRRETQRAEEGQQQEEWASALRSQEAELRNNTFPPANLHTLALAYFGQFHDNDGVPPYERVREFIGGDRRLADAVVAALRDVLWRDDLPGVDETLSLHSQSRMPYLAYPVQASMHLLADGPEPLPPLDDSRKQQALTMYYCFPLGGEETQDCRDQWFRQNPALVLEVLHLCGVAALRNGDEWLPSVGDLHLLTGQDDLVHKARLRLLEAFPTRIPKSQMRQFDALLGKVLGYSDSAGLRDTAGKKLALKSLDVGQRVRWMTVAAILSGGKHTQRLRDFVSVNERRVRHLAEFLNNSVGHANRRHLLTGRWSAELLASLVRMLGPSYRPRIPQGLVTVEIGTSELIGAIIRQLGSTEGERTHKELANLVDDPELVAWRGQLTWARETQRVVRREASFRHPGVEETQRTLRNREPANPADLAALLHDRLETISEHIRGDNANLWRQFWNEDSYGCPTTSKPEDSCRDALLESLKLRLPSGIDLSPEGQYAANRRSDIRAFYAGFNVPIEIKKNSHRNLWSALDNQLINLYTTDPHTSGYGIFLVLWCGADHTTPPPSHRRPGTPGELRRRLQDQLEPDEKRKIAVIVIDITRPTHPGPAAGGTGQSRGGRREDVTG